MKIEVMMKTPDAIDRAINEVVEATDREEGAEQYAQLKMFCERWFQYGEVVKLEIDDAAETCVVVPNTTARDCSLAYKLCVVMKTPDALENAVKEAYFDFVDEDDNIDWAYAAQESVDEALQLCDRWFRYRELITLEVDTEGGTCVVVPNA